MDFDQCAVKPRADEDRCRGHIPHAVPQRIVQAALQYAAHGWPVFPCRADKRPLTSRGFKDATIDPEQIKRCWRQSPNAMIGIPTGSPSGFWALDPDLDEAKGHNGPAELARLEAAHGELPKTLTSVTPRGGRHLLFKWNPERPVTTSPGSLPSSIDVRGEGGYIIVAPSKREDDVAYRWEVPPEECEFAEAPDWLYQLIETPKKRKAAKGDGTPPSVPSQSGLCHAGADVIPARHGQT
jgi:bifunctional DNA primase/polymerase-like protein